jgi:hypothetical protein
MRNGWLRQARGGGEQDDESAQSDHNQRSLETVLCS